MMCCLGSSSLVGVASKGLRMRHTPLNCTRRFAKVALIAISLAGPAYGQGDGTAAGVPGTSGLPVPRYVSLKSDRVNMRNGPGTDYPTAWVYRRAGLPLEVIKEFEGWRQVRDADGAAGWVLQSFLSGRRTALVLPWEIKPGVAAPKVALHYDDSERSRPVAMVEAGVIANVGSCDGRWCHVTIDKFRGYIEQKKLWGVYEGEVFQ